MKILLSIFCVIGTQLSAFTQGIDSLGLARFSDAVLELQNSELIRHGTISVCIKSVKSGQTVFALNQEKSLPSASTLKLVTTATALSLLGSDFRFQTYLEHDGVIRNDTLFGNIYIRGTGDPSLGSDRFKDYPGKTKLTERWISAIKKNGIKSVAGTIQGDQSFFEGNTIADSWIYSDLGNYYGAGPGGLNFNENLYKVIFKPGAAIGDPAVVLGIEPPIPTLSFTNEVLTAEKGSGDQVNIYGTPLGGKTVFSGTVPLGFTTFSVKGSIANPAGFAASFLKENLVNASVNVLESIDSLFTRNTERGGRKLLDQYQSPPLKELCQQTNWWSINLYADAILRMVGKRLTGKSDYDGAARAMTNYWTSRSADMRGFYVKDGSGLSPSGSVTTQNLADILAVETRETIFPDFYKSIAVLGQNGTIRNLGKGTRAAGNIRAKSGSIEGTRAYAGYVTAKSGTMFSFAFLAHKYQQESSSTISEELVKLMTLLTSL
jgi:D-alanyl-D-alanine carboxypeptidase/D-alanyl-D-alanine-endopeptidase (penicillin-binding protein 4)